MSVAASLLSILLFVVFLTSGIQKILFTTSASAAAGHLDYSKSGFQRIGAAEILASAGLIAGVAATSGFWLLANDAAAWGLFVLMAAAAVTHRRVGDKFAAYAPAVALALLCALEAIFRLAA